VSSSGAAGRAGAAMALGTIASRLTGFIRTYVFLQLGFGVLTDTYTLSNTSPNLFYELVVGGVLSATLVPLFVDLMRPADEHRSATSAKRAQAGASAIVTLAATAVVVLSAALWLAAPFVMNLWEPQKGWAPGQRDLAITLLRFFAPQVAMYGGMTLATSLLHTRGRFGITMVAPVMNNLIVIAVFVWVKRQLSGTGTTGAGNDLTFIAQNDRITTALGLGTTAGILIMLLALVPALRSARVGIRWNWNPRHPAVKHLVRLSGWTVGYVAANQVALFFILQVAVSEDGDVTAYQTANSMFFQLPHGILAVSLVSALQPALSRAFVDRRRGDFRAITNRGMRTLIAVMTPAATGYIILAKPITRLTLAHGSTTTADTDRIAEVLVWLAPGLPAFSIYLFLMGALKALRDTRATYEVNVIENAINMLAAAVLYPLMGVAGLGAAFSIAYLTSAVLATRTVAKRTKGLGVSALLNTLGGTLVACGAMGVSLIVCDAAISSVLNADQLTQARFLGPAIGVSIGVGVTVYFVAAKLLGLSELDVITTMISRLTGKFTGKSASPNRSPNR
jgi:putative peptidoglycan lipid II flippase